jgi:hypothetical protein
MHQKTYKHNYVTLLLILTCCFFLSLNVSAIADSEDTEFDGIRDSVYEETFSASNPIAGFSLMLSRQPEFLEPHALLTISGGSGAGTENASMTTCIKVSDFSHIEEYKDNKLTVTLTGIKYYQEDLPQDPHLKCNGNILQPKAEILITKENIENNNINQLVLKAGDAFSSNYKMNITDNYIMLEAPTPGDPSSTANAPNFSGIFTAAKPYGTRNSMKLWLYPEDTLILYMPGDSVESESIKNKLDSLAQKHGLEPLENHIEGFTSPLFDKHQYYYVDTKGNAASKIRENGPDLLDILHADTISYELEGDIPALKEVKVYARTPGRTE